MKFQKNLRREKKSIGRYAIKPNIICQRRGNITTIYIQPSATKSTQFHTRDTKFNQVQPSSTKFIQLSATECNQVQPNANVRNEM